MSGFLVFGVATTLLILGFWWSRRAHKAQRESRVNVKFSRQQLIILSLIAVALAVTEALLFALEGGAPRIVFSVGGVLIAAWIWWRAWRIREL